MTSRGNRAVVFEGISSLSKLLLPCSLIHNNIVLCDNSVGTGLGYYYLYNSRGIPISFLFSVPGRTSSHMRSKTQGGNLFCRFSMEYDDMVFSFGIHRHVLQQCSVALYCGNARYMRTKYGVHSTLRPCDRRQRWCSLIPRSTKAKLSSCSGRW